MTIQESLGAYLGAYPGLVAFIQDRLYPVRARQDSVSPFVVYRFRDRVDLNTLDFPPAANAEAKLLVSAFDENYDTVNQVAEQIRQALSGFQGIMGGGVNVAHVLLDSIQDQDVAEAGLYEVSAEYDVLFAIDPTSPASTV